VIAVLSILVAAVSTGGVFLISREAKLRSLEEDVSTLEDHMDYLRGKVEGFETSLIRIQTKLDNLSR